MPKPTIPSLKCDVRQSIVPRVRFDDRYSSSAEDARTSHAQSHEDIRGYPCRTLSFIYAPFRRRWRSPRSIPCTILQYSVTVCNHSPSPKHKSFPIMLPWRGLLRENAGVRPKHIRGPSQALHPPSGINDITPTYASHDYQPYHTSPISLLTRPYEHPTVFLLEVSHISCKSVTVHHNLNVISQ